MTIGGGVGVGVSTGAGETTAPGVDEGSVPGVALAGGVAGELVAGGGGGVTCARVLAKDASKHAATKAAPQSVVRFTRYAILASLRLTAEASNVL